MLRRENTGYQYPIGLVCGKGLGISYSSLYRTGEIAPCRGIGQSGLQAYVNVFNHNLFIKDRPIEVDECNGKLPLSFVYNKITVNPAEAWRIPIKKLKKLPNGEQGLLYEEDGHETLYNAYSYHRLVYIAVGCASGSPEIQFDEEKQLWVRYHPVTRDIEYYDKKGFLIKRMDRGGNTVSYEYDEEGQLTKIIGSRIYQYQRHIIDDQLRIKLVEIIGDREVELHSYYFTKAGLLERSVSPNGFTTQYHYKKEAVIDKIEQSDGHSIELISDSQGRFSHIECGKREEGIPSFFQFVYSEDKNLVRINSGAGDMIGIDYNQQGWVNEWWSYIHFAEGCNIADGFVYDYYPNGLVKTKARKRIYPDGEKKLDPYSKENFSYDRRNDLLLTHVGNDGQTTEYDYELPEAGRQHLKRIRKINGNKKPTTYYIYKTNQDRSNSQLRFTISPEGRIKEYRYDEKGYLQSERQYTENILEDYEPSFEYSLPYLEAWAEKQNQQKILLKIFEHNPRGQVTKVTTYREIDEKGIGKDADKSWTETKWEDAGFSGLWFSQHSKQNATKVQGEVKVRDSLQRIVEYLNSENERTDIEYKDAKEGTAIKVTLPNKREEYKILNTQGYVKCDGSAVVEDKKRTVRENKYHRDSLGQPLVVIGPDNKKQLQFYDRQHRLNYTVSATGRVTEYIYDDMNGYCMTTQYATRVEQSELYRRPESLTPDVALLFQKLIKKPEKDRTSYQFYNCSGKLIYTVDADLRVVQYLLDDLDRDGGKIAYKEQISEKDLNLLKSRKKPELKPNPPSDRCTQKWYDDDDFLMGERDAAGYITQYTRNAAGIIIKKACFCATGDVAITHYFHNAKGEVTLEVDAEGFVTTFEYNAVGFVTQKRRYQTKVNADWYKNTYQPPIPKESSEDEIISYQYNLFNQVTDEIWLYRKRIHREFDVMGNLILESISDQASPEATTDPDKIRTELFRYNQWGQVIAKTNFAVSQLLAAVEADKSLTPEQKKQKQEKIWETQSTRQVYDDSGLHLRTIDSLGKVTYFYYDDERRLILTIKPTGIMVENEINTFGETESIRSYLNKIPQSKLETLTGGFIDPELLQYVKTLRKDQDPIEQKYYDKRGLIYKKIDPENNVFTFTHNAFAECDTEIHPLPQGSLKIEREYDPRGLEAKITESSGELKRTTSKEYNHFSGKPTAEVNALGARTEFERNGLSQITRITNHDGIKKSQEWDACNRISKTIDAANQVTQHQYNQKTQTETIIFPENNTQLIQRNIFEEVVQTVDSENQAKNFQHNAFGEEQVYQDELKRKTTRLTDTENRLWLTTTPEMQSIELKRNESGQIIKKIETDENSISSYFHVIPRLDHKPEDDVEGREMTDEIKFETDYTPNSLGCNEYILDPHQVLTKNEFDRNQNPVTTYLDPNKLGLTTGRTFTPQQSLSSITRGDLSQLNQFKEVTIHDGLAREIKTIIDPTTEEKGLHLVTEKTLDLANQVIAEKDPNGHIKRTFYDLLGRKRFAIDASGGMEEWIYNQLDQVTHTRRYQHKMTDSISEKTTLAELEKKAALLQSQHDQLNYYFYNKNGWKCFAIEVTGSDSKQESKALTQLTGNVHSFHHNKRGDEVKTIHYHQPIDLKEIETITTEKLIVWEKGAENPSKDRKVYRILDAGKQERFVIDENKIMTEKRFDAMGRVIAKITYATPVKNPEEIYQLPPDKIPLIIRPDEDQATYTIFNSQGYAEFEVLSNGAIIKYERNYYGDVEKECHFAMKVKEFKDEEDLKNQLKLLIPDPSKDRVTEYQYDQARRLVKIIDPLKQEKQIDFNSLVNLKYVIDEAKQKWQYEYDRANRLFSEKSPPVMTSVNDKESKSAATETKTEYDSCGNKTAVIEAYGTSEQRTTKMAYNECNQLSSTKIISKQKETLVEQLTYNATQQVIAHFNHTTGWIFHVYNPAGIPIYRVNQLGFVTEYQLNSFGQAETEINYALPIPLEIETCIKNGVSIEHIHTHLKTSLADRFTQKTYDQQGHLIEQKKQSRPTSNNAFEEIKQFEYTPFGQLRAETTIIDEKTNRLERRIFIYNQQNQLIAEIDPNWHVTCFERNLYGEIVNKTIYATPLNKQPDTTITFAELKSQLATLPIHQSFAIEYDLKGRIKKETQLNVITQSVAEDKATKRFSIKNNEKQSIIKEYTYTPLGKIESIKESNGTQYRYYNERGELIAETDVPRDGIIPLKYYKRNHLGQLTEEIHFKLGTAEVKPGQLPLPIATDKNDFIQQFDVDSFDRLLNQTIDPDGLNIINQIRYHANGKPLVELDANQQLTRHIYNELGQKRLTIHPDGGVSEWKYNALGQIAFTCQYENIIDAKSLNDDSTPTDVIQLLKPTITDCASWKFYDSQKLRFKIDRIDRLSDQQNVGAVKEKLYNTAGHLIKKTTYAKPIDVKQLSALSTSEIADLMTKLADRIHDHTIYYIRDNQGKARFTMNPSGVVTEREFNAQGKMIRKTIYRNRITNPEELVRLTPDEFKTHLKADRERDRTTYIRYNEFNKKSHVMTPNGGVNRYAYNEQGVKMALTQVAKQIAIPPHYSAFLAAIENIQPDIKSDRTTVIQRNSANQAIRHIDGEGFAEEHQYDGLNLLAQTKNKMGATTSFEYDAAKRQRKITHPMIKVTKIKGQPGEYSAEIKEESAIQLTEHDPVGNPRSITKGAGSDDPRTIQYSHHFSRQLTGTQIDNVAIEDEKKIANFSTRPETKQTLTTQTVLNAKGLKVAEKNENGDWHFYVYNSRKQKVFEINAKGKITEFKRNVFGYVEEEVTYANPFDISLFPYYTEKGIPLSEVKPIVSEEDRKIKYAYNKQGSLTTIESDEIKYAASNGERGIAAPRVEKSYDSFEQLERIRTRHSHDQYSEELFWHDRESQLIYSLNAGRFLTQSGFNRFKNEDDRIEFASVQDAKLNVDTPISEIPQYIKKSDQDLHQGSGYDLRGKKTKAITYDPVIQIVENNQIKHIKLTSLSKEFLFNAAALDVGTIFEDGSTQLLYRNDCGDLIGIADVPRRSEEQDAKPTLIPFTEFGVNGHGQTVYTVRYKLGTPKAELNVQPIAKSHEEDQKEFVVVDSRGLPQVMQNAVNEVTGFTHYPTRETAREWYRASQWISPSDFKTLIDEKRYTLDATRQCSKISILRDNQLIEQTHLLMNLFDELKAEGATDQYASVYYERDRRGKVWKSNHENGVPTITLCDLAGNPTIRFQSPTLNLAAYTYAQIDSLFTADAKDVEKTFSTFNLQNSLLTKSSPALYQINPDDPKDLPLQIQAFENKLQWVMPPEMNLIAKLQLTPLGQETKISREIKKGDGYLEASLSDLPSDQYQYLIHYHLPTDAKVIYQTSGIIQCQTQKKTGGYNLLVELDSADPDMIWLSGNTAQLQFVKLLVDRQEVDSKLIPVKMLNDRAYVELQDYPSGFYSLRPVLAESKRAVGPTQDTVPFPLYTQHPSANPFARQYDYQARLSMADKALQIDLNLSKPLLNQPIQLSLDYTTPGQNQIFQLKQTVDFDFRRKTYRVQLVAPIEQIKSLSIHIQMNAIETLGKVWLPLYTHAEPLPNDAPTEFKTPIQVQHDFDWVDYPAEQEEDDFLIVEDNIETTVFTFLPHTVLYITPIKELKETPTVQYQDLIHDRAWKPIDCVGFTEEGILLDVTDFEPGFYPCKLSTLKQAFTFFVFDQQLIFQSDPHHPDPHWQPAQHAFQWDRWSNITEETDSYQRKTNYQFNFRQQLIAKQLPEITYVKDDKSLATGRPSTQEARNIRGFHIAHQDANGKTFQTVLNEAGQELAVIDPDNVRKKSNTWDALGRITIFRNSLNKKWGFDYTRKNEISRVLSPLNKWHAFAYFNGLLIDDNHMGSVIRYDHDAKRNICKTYLADGKRWILHKINRNRRIEEEVQFDGNTLASQTWKYDDYFPILTSHTDLSGTQYGYEYDLKYQLIRKTSAGGKAGKHGTFLSLKKESKKVLVRDERYGYLYITVDVFSTTERKDEQHLQFVMLSGRLISVIDHTMRRKTDYFYNTEEDRIAVEIRNLDTNELISRRESQLNEAGMEISARDNLLILKTEVDLNGNRKHLQSVFTNPETHQTEVKDYWNQFDSCSRAVYDAIQDLSIEYENGFRKRERSKGIVKTLDYYDDGLLKSTQTADRKDNIVRLYEEHNWLKQYWDFTPGQEVHQILEHEANGWLTTSVNCSGNITATTKFDQFTTSGQPHTQRTVYQGSFITEDSIVNHYIGFDSWQLSKICGSRHTTKWGDPTEAQLLWDVNGFINATTGMEMSDSASFYQGQIQFFDTTYDGLILSKISLPDRKQGWGIQYNFGSTLDQIFYTVYGGVLGSYSVTRDARSRIAGAKVNLHYLKQGQGEYGLQANPNVYSLRAMKAPIQPTKQLKLNSIIQAITSTYPSSIAVKYVPPKPQLASEISQAAFGSPFEAGAITLLNGWSENVPFDQGRQVILPEHIESLNRVGLYTPYATFMRTIIGNLTPHLNTRLPEESDFNWRAVLSVVVSGLAMIAAPYLAPYLLGATSSLATAAGASALGAALSQSSLAYSVATGVSAALADAAAQEVAVKLHVQPHFSLREVITTGFSIGIGAELGVFDRSANLLQLSEKMLEQGLITATAQALNLKTGSKASFDPNQVIASMLAVATHHFLTPDRLTPNRFASHFLNESANFLMSSIILHQQPNLSLLAAKALSTSATREAAAYIAARTQRLNPVSSDKPAETTAHTLLPKAKPDFHQSTGNDNRFFSSSAKSTSRFAPTSAPPRWQEESQAAKQKTTTPTLFEKLFGSNLTGVKELGKQTATDINTIGDELNPFIQVPRYANQAYSAFRSGHILDGIAASAGAAMSIVPLGFEGRAFVSEFKVGVAVGKVGGFFDRIAVRSGTVVRTHLESGIPLYRAVKPDELEQILQTGGFRNPYGIENKYFSTTHAGAEQYAQMAEKAFGDHTYTIVKTTIPKSVFESLPSYQHVVVDRGVPAALIPTPELPALTRPEIISREIELLNRRISS